MSHGGERNTGMSWWQFQEEKRKIARSLGFERIRDAYVYLYTQQKKSASEVGRKFRVSPNAVVYRLEKFGIARRPRGGSNRRPKHKQVQLKLFDL